jgi:hypothetical protein
MLVRSLILPDTAALPLQQHPDFALALRGMGRDAQIVPLDRVGQALVIRRRIWPGVTTSLASRGPVWLHDTSNAAQIAALREARLHIINADGTSAQVLRQAGYRQIMAPAHVAELDISGQAADRRGRCSAKWRSCLRRVQEAPLRIRQRPFEPDRDSWLYDKDRAQQIAKRFCALPHDLTRAFVAAQPERAIMVTAQQSGHNIAAMLFLRHGPVATYHIGWTNAAGRAAAAHHQMLMQAADRFAADGATRLDLGAVDKHASPGLARFKIGAGATVRPLGGTWIRIPGL